MDSSPRARERVVNDNIHGDISLKPDEWNVVNTATFQRLRSLKQLGMAHLVYPNATHTRFAHSLGVFRIMCRVLDNLNHDGLSDDQKADLRLAALLHDVGHYPYSHLMERVGKVTLTEDEIEASTQRTISGQVDEYPDHEELGRHILLSNDDIRTALGGEERAKKIGLLFSRHESTDQQLSKLIHSSLDMDRLDYLLRDARAAGVPYGEIDLNYLLNSTKISPKGMLGVDAKALAAAEHFLLARVFMHRSVYYHKTTYGFEEICRQLLRRIRNTERYNEFLATTGTQIKSLCETTRLRGFTDDYVDRIIIKAAHDEAPIIKLLALSILERKRPRLLVEISGVEQKSSNMISLCASFRQRCRDGLSTLINKYKLHPGQFLLCGPKPIKFEERGSLLSRSDVGDFKSDEREELIMVFQRGSEEPRSIVDIDKSILHVLSNQVYAIQRLYLVEGNLTKGESDEILKEVTKWATPPK
ncbi:MAG: HD domain-containing protein [Gemmataceae bacterium]